MAVFVSVFALGSAWPVLSTGCSSSNSGPASPADASPSGSTAHPGAGGDASVRDGSPLTHEDSGSSSGADAANADALAPDGGDPPSPTPAEAAGFLTLAANYDFALPFYATIANWLDCDNTNPNVPWHKGAVGSMSPVPCNETVGPDPQYGGQVLDMQWLQSYGAIPGAAGAYGNAAFVSMMTAMHGANGTTYWPGPVTASFPNMYVESTYRQDNKAPSYQGDGPSGVWTWQDTGPNTTSQSWAPIELDLGELYNGFAGSPNGFAGGATHQWGNAGNSAGTQGAADWVTYDPNHNGKLPPGYDFTAYHTYGALLTSDGATSIYECHFIDDVLQNCADVSYAMNDGGFSARTFLLAWVGGTPTPLPDGGTAFGEDKNLFVKDIRVWSCADWNSSPCNGTTLYDQGGLTYWH